MNTNQKTSDLFSYWRKRVFISVWITYSAFYLTRVNISVALPGLMKDLGYSKTTLGGILTCLFITYAIGQFINGQLGDRFGARKLITFGLLISGILSVIFGFTTAIVTMMFIWGLNGYFQSMGWSPSVKTVANWFPPEKRGRISGLLGTSYQIGNAYSWALAGFLVGALSWRWSFWIPGLIVIAMAIHWYVRGRNAPEEVGLPTIEEEANRISENFQVRKDTHSGFTYTLKLVLMNPKIWCVAIALFCLNIVRYGFMSWASTYMFEVQKATISIAAYKAMAIPIAGSLGAIFAGWISDRLFQSRRAPVAAIMLVMLGLFVWIFLRIPIDKWLFGLFCLLAIGFMTYGPHVLMVGTVAMDFGTRKAAASAAGFIDCFGYIGAALTGIGSGLLIDKYSWNAAFYFWIAGAFIAAILMALLWNYKPVKSKYY